MAASIRNKLFPVLSNFSRFLKKPSHPSPLNFVQCISRVNIASIHTTATRLDLMEFFDDSKNFGASSVKSGRSWTLDELRIKSNEDLHKLWFVLLKEKNMLLTMEHNCNEHIHLFPSPERIDKVEESMENLEAVIHERNTAYWKLEVGEEPPQPRTEPKLDPNDPLAEIRRAAEIVIQASPHAQAYRFKRLLKEKERKLLKRIHNRDIRAAMAVLKKFPNCDKEALQAKYPDVEIEKLYKDKKTLGSHGFNTA